MLDLKVNQFRNFFFDRARVEKAVSSGRRKALSKAGAYIRRSARSSIRQRNKASEPGKPPSSHVGTLRKYIFFGYDPANDSVIVGPAKTNQIFFNDAGRPVAGTVPQILEEGGSIWTLEVFKADQWQRADLRSMRRLAGRQTRRRRTDIEARPYMRPALLKNLHVIPDAFRDVIREAA